jgi:hypothetical protein
MNKIVSSFLSLSSLVLATTVPLNAKAQPLQLQLQPQLQPQGSTLIASWGHGRPNHNRRFFHPSHDRFFNDRPHNDYYQVYDLFCRRNNDDNWEQVGTYNHRSQAFRAEDEYQERGYRCRVSSRDVGYRY